MKPYSEEFFERTRTDPNMILRYFWRVTAKLPPDNTIRIAVRYCIDDFVRSCIERPVACPECRAKKS